MKIWKIWALGAAFFAGIVFSGGAAEAGSECSRVGVSATAITKEGSTMIAKEGLYQSIFVSGRKGRGAVNVNCKYIGVFTTCTARQIACK